MQTSRALIAGLASCILLAAAHAEQQSRVPQIGYMAAISQNQDQSDPYSLAFKEGLEALGYVEGKSIHIEYRYPRKPEDLAVMAANLVDQKLDAIAARGQSIDALRQATSTIPIVIIACDRVDHLVATIARPGGNLTGMACISSDLGAKRLQLFQEAVPGLSRLTVLYNAAIPAKLVELQDVRAAAKTLEIELDEAPFRDAAGLDAALAAMERGKTLPLLVFSDPVTFVNLQKIADFVTRHRLPAMYGFKEFCSMGGLLCYGTSLLASYRRFGYFIDKILKGEKPGDIPIEEPTKFELVVNARAAKEFGPELPQSILLRANEVIE
jgi:putative ABC transport system substrate-binding protein